MIAGRTASALAALWLLLAQPAIAGHWQPGDRMSIRSACWDLASTMELGELLADREAYEARLARFYRAGVCFFALRPVPARLVARSAGPYRRHDGTSWEIWQVAGRDGKRAFVFLGLGVPAAWERGA